MAVVRKPGKPLGMFSLVMINIIAVDSLRTLPIAAQYGFALVFYYLLAAVIFFLPVALISAELATHIPQTGGLYVWVREAFGRRLGFTTIWLQWIYNVVWYPTIMVFIASIVAYLISPELSKDKGFLALVALSAFWVVTLLNCLGMRVSSWVSTLGALLGTLLPMLFMMMLAIIWLSQGKPHQLSFTWSGFFPGFHGLKQWVLFGGILFGLVGMEMSAVHAGDVQNPQKNYPKALAWSTGIILGSLILGSLSIALVIPHSELSLVSGLMDAFAAFFKAYHMPYMISVMAALIIIGGICSVSTWVIGPTKGLLVASDDHMLPDIFHKTNRYGAPYTLLLLQAVLFSILTTLFVCIDNLNASYWLLSELTAQLALIVYILMFAAAIVHRKKRVKKAEKAFQVPGPNVIFYVVSLLGLLTCLLMVLVGFITPPEFKTIAPFWYDLFLLSGIFFFIGVPWFLTKP